MSVDEARQAAVAGVAGVLILTLLACCVNRQERERVPAPSPSVTTAGPGVRA